MPPDSISEHLFLKIFLEAMLPDPPSISMLRMLIVLRTITYIQRATYLVCYHARFRTPLLKSLVTGLSCELELASIAIGTQSL